MALNSGSKFEMPFADAFATLRTSFETMKPRERMMLGGIAIIGLAIGAYYAYGMVDTAKQADAQAQASLLAAQSGAVTALAKQTSTQDATMKAWSWSAETPAIGRAIIEDQLSTLALRSGLAGATVKAVDKTEAVGDLTFVSVDVDGTFSWSAFSTFISGLNGLGKGYVVDSISVSDDVSPKMRMVIKIPLATTAATTAAKPTASAGAAK